ncbi:MAG: trigger factor [Acidobacteria bacterium]|nr:trigger factor [Acidobacteriota bacterium]
MKAELVDVNETRKTLSVEFPSELVDAEIDRVARDYSRKARIPGFRPGKVPTKVVRTRFKDQILHDVMHELVPRALDEALREKGVEPVSTPDVKEIVLQEGRDLTFTASFDTLPPFDPGDFATISLTKKPVEVTDEALTDAMQRLRERAARYDVIEGRGAIEGDQLTVDIQRTDASGASDTHNDVVIEIGASANPPGFDQQVLGAEVGTTRSFPIRFPEDYPNADLANTEVAYTVTVKAIKRRTIPELDDEFAKDMGSFENLEALRTRVRADLEHEAMHTSENELRADLMKALAARVPFDVPATLIEREIDRRLEDFASRLMQQNIDPRQAGIDWGAFRESQRDPAKEAVAAALVLDEVARRESITVSDEEIDQEIQRYAERTNRTPAAIRAQLEKEGGISRISAGLRREKSVDYVMARATIAGK